MAAAEGNWENSRELVINDFYIFANHSRTALHPNLIVKKRAQIHGVQYDWGKGNIHRIDSKHLRSGTATLST